MANEKTKSSPEEQKKKTRDRTQIKVLRGVLAAGAAAMVMNTGNDKVMSQPDFNRNVDPVTQPVPQPSPDKTPTAAWPIQAQVNPDQPEIEPMKMPDLGKPTGLNIAASEYLTLKIPVQEIPVQEKDNFNYDEVKESCDDLHYDICEGFVQECEEAGYGKEKLNYEQKMDLASGAMEVELSKLMSEDLLPNLGELVQIGEPICEFSSKVNGQNLKDPMVQARVERDGKDMVREVKKIARDGSSPEGILDHSQKIAAIHRDALIMMRAASLHEEGGKEIGEDMMDRKISEMYRHSRKFVKDYDRQEMKRSMEKDNQKPSIAQKKLVDNLKRGGYE